MTKKQPEKRILTNQEKPAIRKKALLKSNLKVMIEDNKRDEGQASQNPQQFNSTRNSDDNEILNGGGGVDSRSTHSAEYDRGDSSANSS